MWSLPLDVYLFRIANRAYQLCHDFQTFFSFLISHLGPLGLFCPIDNISAFQRFKHPRLQQHLGQPVDRLPIRPHARP